MTFRRIISKDVCNKKMSNGLFFRDGLRSFLFFRSIDVLFEKMSIRFFYPKATVKQKKFGQKRGVFSPSRKKCPVLIVFPTKTSSKRTKTNKQKKQAKKKKQNKKLEHKKLNIIHLFMLSFSFIKNF